MQRRGKWIWRDRGTPFTGLDIKPALDSNLFVQFRRAFHLDGALAAAPLRISADGRYRLYVNGAYVGRGPARCEPLFQYYDVHNIAPHLRAGENVIAVLVHSYGRDTSWYELPRAHWARSLGCGGLYVECDAIPDANSDDRWRYAVSDAWERDTPAGAVGFVEIFDANRDLSGWTDLPFDDGAWADAVVLEAPGIGLAPPVVAFPMMVERDIPQLFEEHRDAARIASVSEIAVEDPADLIGIAEAAPEPLSSCSVDAPEAILRADGAAGIRLAPGRGISIVIDFGRDVTGYPRFELDAPAGVAVDVAYSEVLRPDGRVAVQRPNPITSQNIHRYVTRDGAQSWEKFDRAGFRYLQLVFTQLAPPATGSAAEVRLRRANINFTSYPVGDRGSFECSDDALNRIWRAGQYTLQLCMQDGFEDCPSREQRQWVGDAYVESMVNYAAFGDARLTAKLIRQVAQSQRRDGMTQMATPSDMSARWPLYIVDYCLSWIMTIGEYVLHTGDGAIVSDVFPSVARSVAWFERHIGREGLLVDPPGWIFIDWAEVDKRGASTALNALLVQALRHAAKMAEHEGAAALATQWHSRADSIAAAIDRLLWDDARGVYVDALLESGQSRRVSQHSTAAVVAAGIAPPQRASRALDYVMDAARHVVTDTGMRGNTAIDEETQVVLAQPFFSHFVHRALAAAGRHDAIVENIRRLWSPMLADGATDTLWEHWHGLESRCHAWSATPTFDLSREVLGVRPISPGFERFRVEPHLAGLDWARGTYPSVRGDIGVEWRRAAGRLTLTVDVPAGTVAEIALPPGAAALSLGGASAPAAMVVGPGRHIVEAALG